MRMDLQTHPKVVRILSETKSDKFRVIGGLHAVWGIFDTHSEDGELSGYTLETMDHVIGWPGFSAAVASVGWLAESDKGLMMPSFEEHNGASAKRRSEDTRRKREERKSTPRPKSVREVSEEDQDEMTTREEKRREEKKVIKKPLSRNKFSDDHMIFAQGFYKSVKRIAPTAKEPNFEAWANEIRLINELDERDIPEMAQVFRFANSDTFWQSNILSPRNFRKHYTELHTKMISSGGKNSTPRNSQTTINAAMNFLNTPDHEEAGAIQ